MADSERRMEDEQKLNFVTESNATTCETVHQNYFRTGDTPNSETQPFTNSEGVSNDCEKTISDASGETTNLTNAVAVNKYHTCDIPYKEEFSDLHDNLGETSKYQKAGNKTHETSKDQNATTKQLYSCLEADGKKLTGNDKLTADVYELDVRESNDDIEELDNSSKCKWVHKDRDDDLHDAVQGFVINPVTLYVESENIPTIDEFKTTIAEEETSGTICYPCGSQSCCDRKEADECFQDGSLDVNIDSVSVNSISDGDDYYCTDYSDHEFIGDTNTKLKSANCAGKNGSLNGIETNSTCTISSSDRVTKTSEFNVDEVKEFKTEKCTNELKTLKSFYPRALVRDQTESDFSEYASYYSLDNYSSATPVVSRLKKTLTWTPRVLSEERFSASRSTTLSSDAASFYTAETSGTFFSARSFQLDSCDNFVTCEDFQKLKLDVEPKSKLSKAKDVFVRGRDFVKSKIECYRKRFPNIGKSDKNIRSRILCHNTCGFSCVQVGKEISLYSIPDTQLGIKGGNEIEVRADNSDPRDSLHDKELENVVQNDLHVNNDLELGMTMRLVHDENIYQKGVASSGQNGVEDPNAGTSTDGTSMTGNVQLPENEMQKSKTNIDSRSMECVSGEATEGFEDDLPVGTEATTIEQRRSSKDSSDSEESRSKKRLRWVSALERTQGTSLASSLATNSRAQQKLWECVDQLLCQREMDPELLLNNLGFGTGMQADDALTRVPDRFLLNPVGTPAVDQYQLMLNHPELHHLLPVPVMGTNQLMQGIGQLMAESGPIYSNGVDVVNSGAGNQSENHQPKKASMHRPTFSAVAQGMKFLHGAQSVEAPPSPDEETEKINSIPSILGLANRKALARQGFYGSEYVVKETKEQRRSLSAADKRRKFHHTMKSKGNWSLTEEDEDESQPAGRDTTTSVDSWSRGLVLKSFSDRYSSESSLESSDSLDDRHQLVKQNSISNLRKQYEETIMRSMDGEYPVFNEADDNPPEEESRKLSISGMRKQQVDRLTLSLDGDGDYLAQSRPASLRDPRSALILAQKSTQSTLTGSPMTPKEINFSYENTLNDGEGEFNFASLERSGKLSQKQSVCIIVEEEANPLESTLTRETILRSKNLSELPATFSALSLRSDSCNTLVPLDINADSDGDLTPRAGDVSPGLVLSANYVDCNQTYGDALSESTSSSATLSTIIQDQLDAELLVSGEMSQNGRPHAEMMRSWSYDGVNNLNPMQESKPKHESFELEEISSTDHAFEDCNENISKSEIRRGTMEKSASTQSDSSGFADLETAGETTQSSPEISLESSYTPAKGSDFNTETKHISIDANSTHNPPFSLPVGLQQENTEFRLDEITETVESRNTSNMMMFQPENVFICKKNVPDSENKLKHINPSLSSISYSTVQEKSLVYTVTVPIEYEANTERLKQPPRYVSRIRVNLEQKSKDSNDLKQVKCPMVMQVGRVTFHRINSESDIDKEYSNLLPDRLDRQLLKTNTNNDESNNSFYQKHNISTQGTKNEADLSSSPDMDKVNRNSDQDFARLVGPCRLKEDILVKKRAKEALVATNSHTAHWLLDTKKHLETGSRTTDSMDSPSRSGRPIWSSTPNLKFKTSLVNYEDKDGRRIKRDGNHSFDILMDEEPATRNHQHSGGNQLAQAYSVDELDSRRHVSDLQMDSRRHLAVVQGGSVCSSVDVGLDASRHSLIGSSYGAQDNHLNYMRLARLVNGPSLMTDVSKMPNCKFTPNVHMKNWTQLPKRKHLEEETLLMQHAVQRYKTELCLMENMLFALYRTAQTDLEPEDRCDVEELQHLWCEVRKEVIKMEELLAYRLKAVMAGNDAYSPLDALEIVQAMIDLLREQLYHQQMCIGRDLSFTDDDLDSSRCPSVASTTSSVSESWMSDISSQMSEIRSSLASAEQSQKQELQERILELKNSVLSEVKHKTVTTENARMLQLQLQAREDEVRRLKMELLLQNVTCGGTRRKQMFESDV